MNLIRDCFREEKVTPITKGGEGSDDRICITFRMDDFYDRCISDDFQTYSDRFASPRASNPFFKRPERLRIDDFTVG